ncbi:MAG: PLP-dependent aminotransferase family protein [Planctomycetaceae bacterium]|nr:PLP-dependent aminotransferase family protein [Planctomycetaceae bacterium]
MTKTASFLDLNLIRLDRRKSTPLTQQLYESLLLAIQSGQLSAGFRLPSTRELALQLSVSRTTVINAFEQLVAEGYLASVVGQGTHVSLRLPEESLMARIQRGDQATTRDRAKESKPSELQGKTAVTSLSAFGQSLDEIDINNLSFSQDLKPFRAGVPALDEFPIDVWSRIVRNCWRTVNRQDLSYGDAVGWKPLRHAIASYLRGFRGVRCTDEQVMIVNGTQQAFDIINRLVLAEGDQVLFESPGYSRAKLAFQVAGAPLVYVPVDKHGLDISKAGAASSAAKLVYVTPSHQEPMGVTMPIERRMQLIEWANQNRAWIVEDDYDSEFRYAHRPIPALQGLDTGNRTIYVGSFSKVVFPSLGMGYVVVPQTLLDGFQKALALVGRPPAKIDQIVLTEFMEEGHFARHLRRMRTVHESRRSALVDMLNEHLSHALQIVGADAGLHCTAILNDRWNDKSIAVQAAERGIVLRPLSAFLESDQPSEFRNGLIFGFACSTPSQIRGAIRKLLPIF